MNAIHPNPADELASWIAQETQQKALMQGARGQNAPPPSKLSVEQLATMDGMAQLQAMMRGEAPPASIGRTLDFLPVVVERGHVVFQGTPGPAHLNPMGVVHGGWFASLLDSALGCAVHSMLPAGRAYTTLELKINMIRALTPKVQRVRAIGRTIHVGGQTATAEARLVGADGKLYAHGTTTCLIFPLPAANPP